MLLTSLLWVGCASEQGKKAAKSDATYGASPVWAQNANIYEVNVRQYSVQGDFAGFNTHLARLDEMGVDILWFMPIFPISETKRKGELGSYYAVSSFREVNPEFGTLEDFQRIVDDAHGMGMRVILDWVPNHTGWDHQWITEHPEWYTQDEDGNIIDPVNYETGESWGWTDVADLNYDSTAMREAMIEDMKYWVSEVGIDGFRMDVAHGVPFDFWEACVTELRRVRPDVFMLAEAEDDTLLNEQLFAMDYGWTFHHLLNHVAQGKANADSIFAWYEQDQLDKQHGYHMQFITNHDENSWAGTVDERMGSAADAMAVVAFTFDGMPLVYSGQEAGLDKRLEFFEADPIEWGDYEKQDFYTTLLRLKHENQALWNGAKGGRVERIETNNPNILAYTRMQEGDRVVVAVNLSGTRQRVTLKHRALNGNFDNIFMPGQPVEAGGFVTVDLAGWDYRVFARQ